MQYLLMIYDEEKVWEKLPEAERNGLYAEYGAFTTALQESGALLTYAPASCSARVEFVCARIASCHSSGVTSPGPSASLYSSSM